jgi:N-acetylglucosamine kinase-like BadF-type ATPase
MIVVGIDGGGTKTEVMAVDTVDGLVGRRVAGPSNLHKLGVQEVSGHIEDLVHSIVPAAAADVLVVACMSGLDTGQMRKDLSEALASREGRWTWLVDNDAAAAWWGAFQGRGAGVVTIAGTGTVSYAQAGERRARAGGWGALLGDDGSGYSLGRGAIMAVLRSEDGMAGPTALSGLILDALGLDDAHQLIDCVHVHMSVSDVAALTPLVFAAAEKGDAAAEDLVASAADALVSQAEAAGTRALPPGSAGGIDAAFVGGVLRSRFYERALRKRVAASPVCRWLQPAADAAEGAVLLGGHHLGLPVGWWSSAPAVRPLTTNTEER